MLGLRHATPADTTLLSTQLFRDGARVPRLRVEKGPWTGGERFGYDARYQLTGRASDSSLSPIDPTPFAPPASAPIGVPPPRQPAIDALIGARIAPDSSAADTAWRYDLVGNRTETSSPAGDHEYEVTDPRDRYLRIDGAAREYDRAGSITLDERREYVYDGFRRLVRVRDRGTGVELARYTYDPLGRRVIEEHDLEQPDADRIVIVHDGADRIADYRDGRCLAQYVHGPGVDDPVELAATGTEHYYHADLQGSVRALTTREGAAAASYRFDPFGVLVESTGPSLGLADVEAAQPFGFAGRPLDPSLGLYDLRARAYDPALGRFLQRDPAGPVDGHLYTYAGNHPLAFGDPSGLAREERAELERKARIATSRLFHMVDTWSDKGEGYWWEEYGQAAGRTTVGSFFVHNKNRVLGAARVTAGYGIAAAGYGLMVIPGGQLPGAILVGVGVDQMAAGSIEVITNRPQESYIHRGARAIGGSRFADNFEMAATIAAPAGAGVGASRALRPTGVIPRSSAPARYEALEAPGAGRTLQGVDMTELPGRLTPDEMRALQSRWGVEHAQIYVTGPGRSGGGGIYYLVKGEAGRVSIPIASNIRLINHTHPTWLSGKLVPVTASFADQDVLRALQRAGSPQQCSQVVPETGKPFLFDTRYTHGKK